VLRGPPAKPGTWLSAKVPGGVVVHVRQEDEGLWLETPEPDRQRSLGRHTALAEAARAFSTPAEQGRADVRDAIVRPW
jgi:hypothetical protein